MSKKSFCDCSGSEGHHRLELLCDQSDTWVRGGEPPEINIVGYACSSGDGWTTSRTDVELHGNACVWRNPKNLIRTLIVGVLFDVWPFTVSASKRSPSSSTSTEQISHDILDGLDFVVDKSEEIDVSRGTGLGVSQTRSIKAFQHEVVSMSRLCKR
jgi:hypothetical protein